VSSPARSSVITIAWVLIINAISIQATSPSLAGENDLGEGAGRRRAQVGGGVPEIPIDLC
jgi:hypothetical protein